MICTCTGTAGGNPISGDVIWPSVDRTYFRRPNPTASHTTPFTDTAVNSCSSAILGSVVTPVVPLSPRTDISPASTLTHSLSLVFRDHVSGRSATMAASRRPSLSSFAGRMKGHSRGWWSKPASCWQPRAATRPSSSRKPPPPTVDTEAITTKVRQEFAAKEKAKKAAQPVAKAATKAA
jgi:hypothetical protein